MAQKLVWMRLIFIVASLLLSVIVLGLTANMIATVNKEVSEQQAALNGADNGFDPFGADADLAGGGFLGTFDEPIVKLPLAVAVLTIVYYGGVLVVDFLRQGSIFTTIMAEIGPLTLLWILWLASGANISQTNWIFSFEGGCDAAAVVSATDGTYCKSLQAVEALSFLIWIALFAYYITLISYASVSQSKGVKIWNMHLRDASNANAAGSYGGNNQMQMQGGVPMNMMQSQPQVQMQAYPQAQMQAYPQAGTAIV